MGKPAVLRFVDHADGSSGGMNKPLLTRRPLQGVVENAGTVSFHKSKRGMCGTCQQGRQ